MKVTAAGWGLKRAPVNAARGLLVHLTTVPMTLRFLRGQPGYMRQAGFEVAVVSSPGPALDAFAEEQQVQTWAVPMARRISPLRDLVSLCRLVALLYKLKPTVVEAHTPKAGLLGMLAATLTRTPFRIYHLHGLPLETARGLKFQLLRMTEWLSCALSHRVLAVSHSLRESAVARGLVASGKIAVPANGSANGVDVHTEFNPQLHRAAGASVRDQLGITRTDTLVGFVGRLVRDKGVVELEQAWRRLREDFPEAQLLLIGPEEKADAIPESTLEGLRSDPRIRLLGIRDDVPALMAAMDVLVLPTYREGFPYVLLEAASMGLPTIATRTTGCVDAVLDGQTGALVSAGNSVALAEAISGYLRSSELRAAHGARARERVVRQFDQSVVWSAILSEYESALATLKRGADEDFPTGTTTEFARPDARLMEGGRQ